MRLQDVDISLKSQMLEMPLTDLPTLLRSRHRTPVCRIAFCPEVLPVQYPRDTCIMIPKSLMHESVSTGSYQGKLKFAIPRQCLFYALQRVAERKNWFFTRNETNRLLHRLLCPKNAFRPPVYPLMVNPYGFSIKSNL